MAREALLVMLFVVIAGMTFAASLGARAALVEGVGEIAAPGWPGQLCVFGPEAEAVVVGKSSGAEAPVVAAAQLGAGRLVLFGHDGYFGREALKTADTGRLLLNAVRWASGKTAPRALVVEWPEVVDWLREQGLEAIYASHASYPALLSQADVVLAHQNWLAGEAGKQVSAFVKAGGGLVSADTPWGWLQLNPGKNLLTDHPGNAVVAEAGVVWSDGGLDRTSKVGFDATLEPSAYVNASTALDALLADAALSEEEQKQVGATLTTAARGLPESDTILRPRLKALEAAADSVPSPNHPLTLDNPKGRLALTLQLEELNRLPLDQRPAHPSAAFFPGAVPEGAPRLTKTILVDTSTPGWHSTGLYAAPGEAITLFVPEAAAGKGLGVRIGAHTDTIWHLSDWQRAPEISTWAPLEEQMTRLGSAFGGLIYVDVPDGCDLQTVGVTIEGGLEAPFFQLGKTTNADWTAGLRDLPAPWAELACDSVILTLPSEFVRELDDPTALMEFWQSALDACADLATISRVRARPERYTTDVQISAGYMHSGYPIMTFLDIAPVMVDLPRLKANQHGGVWGLWHEMGHNHQQADWTFEGTVEVTVNLFTMYVLEKCSGLTTESHPALNLAERAKRDQAYLDAGAQFDKWKSNPFLALDMYIQLKDAFGWDAYKQVFAEYRRLSPEERPKTDEAKRDQWMVRFSKAVKRNLGPFFQLWGVPTSEEARASIADLPVWIPEELAGYRN